VREGYVEPNEFDQHATGYAEAEMDSSDSDDDYTYVAVTYHPEDYSIIMTIPTNVPMEIWDRYEDKVESKVYGESAIKLLNEASQRVFEKTLKDMASEPDQKDLPGLGGQKFIEPPRDMKISGYIPSSLSIDLQTSDDDRVVQSAYSIAKFIDNNFEEFKKRYIENIKNYGDEEPVTEAADYITTGYQKIARKQFGKGMRLTVRGGNRYKVGKMKVINPKVGKSAPPGME
jgi:hypothetical protein